MQLKAGPCVLTLAPDVGGSVAAFTYEGRNILRPLPDGAADPLQSAGFPLFPFSGRVDHGRFSFEGADYTLPPNFLPEPHAIHGQAWQAPWVIEEESEASATLSYHHAGDIWPWPYCAEQKFTLREAGFVLDLALTNLGQTPMPAGIGWHPYFPKKDATLQADVTHIWRSGADMIPAKPEALGTDDLTQPRQVEELALDNNFTAGPGGATITWPDGIGVQMRAEGMAHLVIYTPPSEDFFCVEPVTHAPNAVNSALPAPITGLQVLGPQATLQKRIAVTVIKA